ncbi:unnamed protein product [Sphenostylis stenocarpa]|uniref:S-acyltransferase n=1 Tax=Sphenostylis stenocarpa TaxID=92480 RepID=A0AA86RSL4_9FABA|nr:unnamed protein product [Sphenostylis stenocarpa]
MSGNRYPQMGGSSSSNVDHTPKRVYQVWRGGNKFFCGGRMVFGPDVASLFLTIFLIAAPAITFCVKAYLKIKKTGDLAHEFWFPVLVVGSILTVLDLMFLLLTSGRDPGIVPRNSRPPELDDTYDMPTPSMEWINGTTPHLKLPRTKDVVVNDHIVKVKFCDTCLLYRPPRTSHCSICNNCVERFDHHCPWVGQCIGITTYENFRYQYDKKGNPFNRGSCKNINETLCSSIPRSKNNFRAFVAEDEHMMVGSMTPSNVDGILTPKEKLDFEMGSMHAEDGRVPIPELLRNFDFDNFDDDMKFADEGQPSFDPFYSIEDDGKGSSRTSNATVLNFQSISEDGMEEFVQSSNAAGKVRESSERHIIADGHYSNKETKDRNHSH